MKAFYAPCANIWKVMASIKLKLLNQSERQSGCMNRKIKFILLINLIFIFAAITKDFWLLIPLNIGMLWNPLKERLKK